MSWISTRLGYGKRGIVELLEGSFVTGQKTIGGTSAQLIASSTPAYQGVLIKAHTANTGRVYVDAANPASTTTGVELSAGDAILIPVDDANKIYLIASAANQVISYMVA